MTSACCNLGMSAGHCLTTLAHHATQTVFHPFRLCYGTFIRRHSALVSCCWIGWSCACRILSYPFVFCADLLIRLFELKTKCAHICTAAFHWWLSVTLTIITTSWRTTHYALSSFNNVCQRCSSLAQIFLDLPHVLEWSSLTFGPSSRRKQRSCFGSQQHPLQDCLQLALA